MDKGKERLQMYEILISGCGGQGIMLLGKILAEAAVKENKWTTWIPSYDVEVRGGSAYCFVKISDKQIASPFIEKADIAIIMNNQSFDKFEKSVKSGGLAIINTDLCQREFKRRNLTKIKLPLNQIALECGDIKYANLAALGVLVSIKPSILKQKTIIEVIKDTFIKENIFRPNLEAFYKGERVRSNLDNKIKYSYERNKINNKVDGERFSLDRKNKIDTVNCSL